jgi:hypothetical protein
MTVARQIRMGGGSTSKKVFVGRGPPPVRIRINTELSSPARGEDTSGARAPAAQRGTADYVSVKLSSPSFSIEVTTLSPGFSHTCLSLGWPAITPSGVPVKMMSPGLKVKYFEM